MNMKDLRGQSLSPLWQSRGGEAATTIPREECTSLNIQNIRDEVQRYQSHFEVLGLHLFVRDVRCSPDDCANSSKATYSSYTPHSICLCCLGSWVPFNPSRKALIEPVLLFYVSVRQQTMFWLFTITVLVNLCVCLKCNYEILLNNIYVK